MSTAALLAAVSAPTTSIDVAPLRSCRFCLRCTADMRPLPIARLPQTDIPQLFESVTNIKLDLSAGYSELWCVDCEHRLRMAAQTRADFVRVAQQWQHILRTNAAAAAASAQGFKIEQADEEHAATFSEANFVDCSLAAFVKTEHGRSQQDIQDEETFRETLIDSFAADKHNDAEDNDYDNAVDDVDDDDDDNSDSDSDSEYAKPSSHRKRRQHTKTAAKSKTRRNAKPAKQSKSKSKTRKQAYGSPPKGMPLTCDICGSRLSTRKILLNHMRCKHHPQLIDPEGHTNRTTCHICGKTGLKSMSHHMRDHRLADQYKCAHCPRTFSRAEMQVQHERTHTGERPFICDICGFSFTSLASLKHHSRMRHFGLNGSGSTADAAGGAGGGVIGPLLRPQRQQIIRVRVTADERGASTATSLAESAAATTGLVVQRIIGADPKLPKLPPRAGIRLECPVCHKTYVERTSLHVHMKIQHGPAGLMAWKQFLATTCLVCNEKFATAAGLAAHKPVHMAHQCDVCKRRFQSSVSLERHVRMHPANVERRFKCDECGASYTDAFKLRTHQLHAHSDERPFQCTQCTLAFVHRFELNAHTKKQHSFWKQLRPHRCEECGESYRTLYQLNVHREKHTGQFRFQCKVCGRNLFAGPQLEQHMQSYHLAEWQAGEAMRLATTAAAAEAAAVAAASVGMDDGMAPRMEAMQVDGVMAGHGAGNVNAMQ